MNEAEKCPVCRSDGRKERGREDGEYVAYYVCDTCMFMCGLEDLPRIAAAMELAKAEAELNTSVMFLFENEAIDDDTPEFAEWLTTHKVVMKQHMTAKDRVLEVLK